MKELIITNCHECPFVNIDNEYGYDGCSIKDIKLNGFEELPEDKIHNECPLRNDDYLIKTNNTK